MMVPTLPALPYRMFGFEVGGCLVLEGRESRIQPTEDEMGLGKTLQALALAAQYREDPCLKTVRGGHLRRRRVVLVCACARNMYIYIHK